MEGTPRFIGVHEPVRKECTDSNGGLRVPSIGVFLIGFD